MWKELNERKWELRHNSKVLATIYEKTKNRYAVYIAVPLIFEQVRDIVGKTYTFKTFDEAKEQCDKMLKEQVLGWCEAAVSYCQSKTTIDGRVDKTGVSPPEKLEFGGQDRP